MQGANINKNPGIGPSRFRPAGEENRPPAPGAPRLPGPGAESPPPSLPGSPEAVKEDMSWVRPDSPTLQILARHEENEELKNPVSSWPIGPGAPKPLSAFEAAASEMFRNNMDAVEKEKGDSRMRFDGEFGQTYRLEDGHAVAHSPMRYEPGHSVGFEPEHLKGMHLSIHSHPPDSPQEIARMGPDYTDLSGIPSYRDYMNTYKAAKGNTNPDFKADLIHLPQTDSLIRFKAKLYPEHKLKPHPDTGLTHKVFRVDGDGHLLPMGPTDQVPKFREAVNLYRMDPPQGGLQTRRPLPDKLDLGAFDRIWNSPNRSAPRPTTPEPVSP